MFSKVLIANRGEIAVRVIRACRELGITSVAVYSDLDRNALHTRLADEAYALPGQSAAETYLNTESILKILEECEADAVHPGYGFFSENADFAREIEKKGIKFIGPPPESIEVMGDKISARQAAENVGVLGVPGTTELITSPEQVHSFAETYGYPVAIKAAYGGGGRGMKVVSAPEEVESAIDSAQRESLAYFGRDELYMERYLTAPRHIEIQILADEHGNVIYLGDRDCSAQRRHQKLIEEAPAPDIPESIKQAMGEAAVKVAKGCGYTNAGTVEFLYEDGEFYYLEMNTRLQVEHPVTELVTGIDLVEQQLKIADGSPLDISQEDLEIRGHAIEIRINAENPAGGSFLPSPGKITELSPPDGFGVRFDSGYESGDEISQFYDNLIAKLVVWGKDRITAINRSLRALSELEVSGVATTIPADIAILEHEDFQSCSHSTKWVEDSLDLSGISSEKESSKQEDSQSTLKKETTVEVNGKRFDVTMWVPDNSGVERNVKRRSQGKKAASGSGTNEVRVPMQGTIIKVLVEVGDSVEIGDPICVLEAMKMENNILAEKAGKIMEIRVSSGDSVENGDVVAVIE